MEMKEERLLSEDSPLDTLKKRVEIYSALGSIAYKLAAAAGAVITAIYLLSINFFPQGLTPAEVIFFVFVAIAFGIIYLILVLYGAFSVIWIIQSLAYVFSLFQFRARKRKKPLSADERTSLRKIVCSRRSAGAFRLSLYSRFRAFRRQVTRDAIQKKSLVPAEARGFFLFLGSSLVFLIMFAIPIALGAKAVVELFVAFSVGGFFSLLVLANLRPAENQLGSVRWALSICLPLVFVIAFGKPLTLLNVVFNKLGIRAEHVSIEVPDTQQRTFDRIAAYIGFPILDCRRTPSGKVLLHNATVLWSSVGNQVLVQYALPSKKEIGWFDQEPEPLKKVSVALDAKDLQIVKAKPPLDPCFDLPSDMLFSTGEYKLTDSAVKKLEQFAAVLKDSGTPVELHIRGYSDPRPIAGIIPSEIHDNQQLSELRASAVGSELQRILNIPKDKIHPEGLGAQEPKVKCPPSNTVTKYEAEQCNKPNRRVEVFVTLSQNKGAGEKAKETSEK